MSPLLEAHIRLMEATFVVLVTADRLARRLPGYERSRDAILDSLFGPPDDDDGYVSTTTPPPPPDHN